MKHSEIRTHEKIRRLVLAAVFAALSCVATMLIQIPSPMNGYVNMGDCFVLLGALFLGPVWGALAGGLGSMLADLFTGYAHYAPGTFLIKALMALVLYGIYRSLTAGKLPRNAAYLIGAAAAELVMVVCLSAAWQRAGGSFQHSRQPDAGSLRRDCFLLTDAGICPDEGTAGTAVRQYE